MHLPTRVGTLRYLSAGLRHSLHPSPVVYSSRHTLNFVNGNPSMFVCTAKPPLPPAVCCLCPVPHANFGLREPFDVCLPGNATPPLSTRRLLSLSPMPHVNIGLREPFDVCLLGDTTPPLSTRRLLSLSPMPHVNFGYGMTPLTVSQRLPGDLPTHFSP